jgi:hypothetical protein
MSNERNPIAELLADVLALALTRPEVIEAARAILAPRPPVEVDAPGLLSKGQLARALHVSTATIGRLDVEGMPHTIVGTRHRYDVDACRTWLASRGRKPTKAKPSDRDVDVSDVLASAGLRVVGGSR